MTQPTVALFATCINDTMYPDTAIAVVKLLERLGCRVVFPDGQTCCGQMLSNSGYIRQAEPVVRTFVRAFEPYDYVVGPSGSCVGSVRHQHPMIAGKVGDEGLKRASEQIGKRVFELSEFLVDVLQVTDVGARFPHRVTYHPTCHSVRVARVGDRPLQLLRAVKDIDLVDLPAAEQCCGFGGTFSVKNPDTSVAMGSDKVEHALSTGAEFLVAGDNSCLMHLGGLLSRRAGASPRAASMRTIHLAEILASTGEESR